MNMRLELVIFSSQKTRTDDIENDLHVSVGRLNDNIGRGTDSIPGQEMLHQRNRPLFQRFLEQVLVKATRIKELYDRQEARYDL
jgi:hypothetical protein